MNFDQELSALMEAIERRLAPSDLATWHSAADIGDGAIAVFYRKRNDPLLYGQVFDRAMFSLFEDETVGSMAATIVAGELEPPHDRGSIEIPSAVDPALLPAETVHWIRY